ncbi:AcrR family transcriptional regulator [Streptosporangium becharense]|uniref:AcrR family transcriptional regulator n=1 Tax=Streptosporangium becharense TaxID=1816182 RepID=A0A7W9MEM5_9ACTN|nr:TetR/AcrR family transcriptional regulator [Streptosporangium becharense]MBB2913048.1 AcrR family transcriptional regulator [Streptosporangium becharense]MBB5818127.1 AcrR family transcriptional regulator [Streptosporangium becharense]
MQAAPRGRRPRYCSRACQARAYRSRAAERVAPPAAEPAATRTAVPAVRTVLPSADGTGESAGYDDLGDARPVTGEHAAATPEGSELRSGLSTERIVRAAIRIADAEGLDALSMRRVATELGAGTMSLYRYVLGKDALIELMVDAVFGENAYPAPVPGNWRARLEAAARREWTMYSRHPWVLRVIATPRPPLGPNLLTDVEWTMRALDGLGLDSRTMQWVATMVSAQVQGAALMLVNEAETERRTGVTTPQWRASKTPMLREILESGRFPMLSRFYAEQGDQIDIDEWFEFSLRRLLDGLAVLIEHREGEPCGRGADPVGGMVG